MSDQPIRFADNPVVAHRGAWKKNNLPENSIAALKEAIRLNCTGSEFDIHMTADDTLIINHDPHYNNLLVESTTYRELVKTPLSNGEKLPTLREYIRAGLENNKSTMLVCEIKPSRISKERGKMIASKVVQLVRDMKAQNMVMYISFDYDMVLKIREVDPNAHVQYLNGEKSPEQLKADNVSGLDYHYSVFRKEPGWIGSAKQLGLALNVWTVNDAPGLEYFLSQGFQYITTNEPELLFEIIKQKKSR